MTKNEVEQDCSNLQELPFFFRLICKTIFLLKNLPLFKDLYNRRLGSFNHHKPVPLKVSPTYSNQAPTSLQTLPIISIVTPSFNQAEYIENTIQSVLGQDYPKLEYIIKDGGSSDGSIAKIEHFRENLKSINTCNDSGQANALNIGFASASGEIMAYLNSDDMYLPGELHYIANFFKKNPEIDVVYGHRIIINEKGDEIGRWIVPPHTSEILYWADYVPQETLFWRKRLWEDVGGFIDETYKYAMDWELLIRFQKAGAKFQRLPRFLGAFRVHLSQKTTAMEAVGLEEMGRLRKQNHGRVITPCEIAQKTLGYQTHALLLYEAYRWGLLRY